MKLQLVYFVDRGSSHTVLLFTPPLSLGVVSFCDIDQ